VTAPGNIFGELLQPAEAMEPILARPVRNALLEWLEEVWAADDLVAVGLTPRRRALFSGAAGTGKTTLAHHIAARLGLPMAIIRPDDIHGRFLGTDTANVKKIFDAAESFKEPILLFFDEFDTAASKRMHSGVNQAVEHDHNAKINTLLARLDGYEGFIIAATNRADAIDESVWRRFEIHITMELPGQFERERIIARYLAPFGLPADSLRELATSFETANPALIRGFCENLKRQIVIGPKCNWDMARGSVIERLLEAVKPHPDAGNPRLWTLGARDRAIQILPWPMPKACDLPSDEARSAGAPAAQNVVSLVRGKP
jgi:SpoVK/Ycf46/Vps4 family AAA+-type ATPase